MGEDKISSKFDMDAIERGFKALADDGYGLLTDDNDEKQLQTYIYSRNYTLNVLEAIREGYANGEIKARVDGFYRNVPREVSLKIILMLRANGVQLKLTPMLNSEDLIYWGRKLMK